MWLVQVAYGSKHSGMDGQYGAGHHLPTGPKSSVAYGIKSDHKQNTKNREGEEGKNKGSGGQTVNNPCSISTCV